MLKKLRVKMTTSAPEANGIPVVQIAGDLIAQYNKADQDQKAAKAVMDDIRPEILEIGHEEIFRRSCEQPLAPTLTVKLSDEGGEAVRVEFTKKYGVIANVAEVERLFEQAVDTPGNEALDINDFVQEAVTAKFDCAVFYDAEGNFQQKVYDAFRKAIEEVALRLRVNCPLETGKIVSPKDKFHTERFRLFGPKDQVEITELIPNTTRVVPIRPALNLAGVRGGTG